MAGSDFTSGGKGGGFLSRVAKLVKSGGGQQATSWGDLDQRVASSTLGGDQQDVAYSKAALKDMMERKRHNDFVRKREFEMLRKMRRRARGLEGDTSLRPSFFVSSMNYTRPANEREQTLKKINEIEEQMSEQWWQAKHGGGAAPAAQPAAARAPAPSPESEEPVSPAYAKTAPIGLGMGFPPPAAPVAPAAAESEAMQFELKGKTHSSPLEMGSSARAASLSLASVTSPLEVGKAAAPAIASSQAASDSFSPSREFSIEVQEVVHDPEMEEAAILFANDEDDAAEASLVAVISEAGPRQTHEPSWLTLFDFYRAVGNHDKFEDLAMEFVTRFGRSAPQWFSMPEMLGLTEKKRSQAAVEKPYDWRAPSTLSNQSVATMQAVLSKLPQPWRLDWTPLKKIEDAAVPLLQKLASEWVAQPLELHFIGIASLEKALEEGTVGVDKDSPQERWQLRLLMTRLMLRDEDFESLALEFCVTYEVSPPAWERTKNKFQSLDESAEEEEVMVGHTIIDSMLVDDAALEQLNAPRAMAGVELSGQIHGAAEGVIHMLEERRQGQSILVIDCSKLMRIDFTAAGNILNWVIEKKSQGVQMQFSNTHRLVSALFDALGISEQARVTLRVN